jgi:hypothetical protein
VNHYEELLFNSVEKQDIEGVRTAIASGQVNIDLVAPNDFFQPKNLFSDRTIPVGTALYEAVGERYQDIVELLLKEDAQVNVVIGAEKLTPLHIAAMHNDIDIGKILIENGANIEARDAQDYTPLHFSARYGHKEFTLFY